ncbi:protein ImuB [Acidovorax soli]|uniref:Protein ImuB n=1 Tax=Acidovorax soli TaxID=592050 RepID=A0A7X0PBL0_9BURK|nr:DNA polymerase Y family protein [Acidovorax soli]MBB6558836.1 protein ImuB [Acidovorax soli]
MLGIWAALRPSSTHSASCIPIDLPSLAVWALQFAPRVAVLEEAVLVEVGASARLFGGLEQLRQRVEEEGTALGVECIAWAPTGTAALALVRGGVCDGFAGPLPSILDKLPLETITAVASHLGTLQRLGCRTLGDVRKLPRGGLSRRFDTELLTRLDQAYGLRPEAYEWVQLPETFSARLEFQFRVEHAPALMFGARRLLLQMSSWLAARHMGVTSFTLRWWHDVMRAKTAGTGGELTVGTAEPTQSVDHLSRLLNEHLAKVELQAPAGDIELVATRTIPIQQESKSLLPDTIRQGEATWLVLERVQARIGKAEVVRPLLAEDHRPEWMQRWPGAEEPRPRAAPGPCQLPVPDWIFEEPLRLAERDHRPIYQGPLVMLLGPDRVEGGWWHRVGEGADAQQTNVQRDYWVAQSQHAGRLWIYQQRLANDETGWFLHGRYA